MADGRFARVLLEAVATPLLKIHEWTMPSGRRIEVFLRSGEGRLEIVDDDEALSLPDGALAAVFRRYGAPFDHEARTHVVAALALPDGERLHHVRHLAGYDVIARDYLVLETSNAESSCALATTVSGALAHLARAASRARERNDT